MRCSTVHRTTFATLAFFAVGSASAQTIPAGVYSMPDSGYSIDIRPEANDLRVNEAGKDRVYVQASPGIYEFTNPMTGAVFQLHYRDRGSVEAKKVGSGNAPTLLVRQGGSAPEEAAKAAPDKAMAAPENGVSTSPYLAIAERYQSRALTDKKDVQTWAFCSAAALKRGMATEADADAYGRDAAARLASISVDPASNPCADAIPDRLWPKSDSVDTEALTQANAVQLAAAAKQSAEIVAMRAKQAADQKAYDFAQADYQAALAKGRKDQELYAQQQADYQAALADHQRQTEKAKPSR